MFIQYACDELWTHSFPLHFRLRPHLHVQSTSKSPSGYHAGEKNLYRSFKLRLSFYSLCLGLLLRELSTHFSALAVHNRKNLFVYCGERNYYYMRFREDTLPPSLPSLTDENATVNDGHHPNSGDLLSPQIYNGNNTLSLNNSMRNRQRHDSVRNLFS